MQTILRRIVPLLVLAAVVTIPASVLAQADARFSGNVIDPSGGFVANVPVTIINERTGETRMVTTSAEGHYLVANLKPSSYTIRVMVPNFAPLEYTGLTLAAAQEFPLDL